MQWVELAFSRAFRGASKAKTSSVDLALAKGTLVLRALVVRGKGKIKDIFDGNVAILTLNLVFCRQRKSSIVRNVIEKPLLESQSARSVSASVAGEFSMPMNIQLAEADQIGSALVDFPLVVP
jgi:hypothetical protein